MGDAVHREVRQATRLAPVVVVMSVLGAALAGCMAQRRMDGEFRKLVPFSDINMSVVLDSPVVNTNPGPGILITIRLSNESASWTMFPPEYGAIGLVWRDGTGEWEELPNKVKSPDIPYFLGPSNGEDPNVGVVLFSPGEAWPDSAAIRVVVHGQLRNQDGTPGKDVVAFIDVTRPE